MSWCPPAKQDRASTSTASPAASRRLPERERTVTVLSFYADADPEEIGAELGLSPGNVRVVRHRALGRLRGCMEGES